MWMRRLRQLRSERDDYLLRPFLRLPAAGGLDRFAGQPGSPVFLLGDGESGWPDAATFRWPDCDAYGKLTRGHFRVVSVSPLPPARRYETRRGVYAYEPSLRQPAWRWLDADAALRVFPRALRATAAAVTLALPDNAPRPAVTVALAVDGVPAAALTLPRGSRQTVELPLPAAGAAEIAFRSDAAFVPAAAGVGTDTRKLAVQLIDLVLHGR